MIELLIAFGLMVILLSTVFVIFDTGSKVFSGAAAKLEIMEMARTLFHIMERDLNGAQVDMDGRVFRGYAFAAHGNRYFGGRKVFGIPALNSEWRSTSYYLWPDRNYKHGWAYTDLLWFRTTSAPEARGGQAEIIYRLAAPPGGYTIRRYYGGTLERGYRTSWPPSTGNRTDPDGPYLKEMKNGGDARNCSAITTCPPQMHVEGSGDTVMQIIPIAPFCYDFKLDYLDPFRWDTREVYGFRMHSGVTLDRDWGCATREVWPPRYGGRLSEDWVWGGGHFTANECRRQLPAAVRAYVRLGDFRQTAWTDYALDFGSWQRQKDGQKQVDEIGLVFEQLFFIPKHVRFPYPD